MKSGRGRLILIGAYFAFFVATVYAANTNRLFAPISVWLHATPGADKICHFLLVGTLAIAGNWFLNCRPIGPLQLGTVICLTLATLEEFSQLWIPSRSFDLLDLAMNTLGILLLGPLAKKLPVSKA